MARRPKPYWPSLHGPKSPQAHSTQAHAPQDHTASRASQPAVELNEALRYLSGYSEQLRAQVATLISEERLGALLLSKYPQPHEHNSDKLLRAYTQELKQRYLRSSPPLSKVCYDGRIHLVHNALGTHTFVSRRQGQKLKSKHELRISTLFKRAPEPLLKMIVVHELAHLKEKEHNESFYQLCLHMDEAYHQHELDARLYLIHQELVGALYHER